MKPNKSLQLTPWRAVRIGAWSSEFHAELLDAAAQLSSMLDFRNRDP
jgi:hypothetical protein